MRMSEREKTRKREENNGYDQRNLFRLIELKRDAQSVGSEAVTRRIDTGGGSGDDGNRVRRDGSGGAGAKLKTLLDFIKRRRKKTQRTSSEIGLCMFWFLSTNVSLRFENAG